MMFDPAMDADVHISTEDRLILKATIAADDAFVAAMLKQIKRGKEKVEPGVKVDYRDPKKPLRIIRGEPIFSCCGSPAASCAEKGNTTSKDITSYV